jgi:alkylation response protein AidB-like acyl-CoA dehydrogenase
MNFELTEEQGLLQDTVMRVMTDEYDATHRQKYCATASGWSPSMWARYRELGLLGLLVTEESGGHGGGGVEMMLVMQAFGKALVMEPYLGSALICSAILSESDSEEKARLLPGLISGMRIAALAHEEEGTRGDIFNVETSASFDSGLWTLEGRKSLVLNGDVADTFIVTARSSGRLDGDRLLVFGVDADAPGVQCQTFDLQDGRRAASVSFDNVRVGSDAVIADGARGADVIARAWELGLAAVVAETVGAMQALLELTVDYLKTRVQFGKPIGSNQVLQHRAVDMQVALEEARSMATLAALSLSERNEKTRTRHLSMAKAHVGALAKSLSQSAVQLHGGIAMTEEFIVGQYFKRILVNEQLFGDSEHHLGLLAETLN